MRNRNDITQRREKVQEIMRMSENEREKVKKLFDMMRNLYNIINKKIHRTLIIVHIYSIFTF